MSMNQNVGYKNKHGKINLPWANEPIRDIKGENTRAYWLMSQEWNGVGESAQSSTIGDALSDCNEILTSPSTPPNSALSIRVCILRDDIIHYGSKKTKDRKKKSKLKDATQDNKPSHCKMILL